jgi:hypothetical protein
MYEDIHDAKWLRCRVTNEPCSLDGALGIMKRSLVDDEMITDTHEKSTIPFFLPIPTYSIYLMSGRICSQSFAQRILLR